MDDRTLVGVLGFAAFFALTLLRVPVGLGMVLTGLGGSYVLSVVVPHLRFEPYLLQFKTLLFSTVANYDLSVVPLFILMGFLAAEAKVSRDLFDGLNAVIGRMRGGLAIASIAACAGFGAVSGSSLATASAMGKIALPQLEKHKYALDFATGTLAAGGTLGILIPPSIALVLYAILVDASIVQMFQAAILPGILAVILFITLIAVRVALNPDLAPVTEPGPLSERRDAILRLIPVALIFLGLIGGLGFGLFTPTPAAAIGVFAVFVYGLVRRAWLGDGLTLNGLKKAALATAVTAAMIYFILFGAEVLKGFFTRTGITLQMAEWAAASALDPWLILIAILVLLIVMGCIMESLSLILVVVPFVWPLLVGINGGADVLASDAAFGVDTEDLKIWFGILCLVVVELGLITPPVGLNVFAIKSLRPLTPMSTIFRGVMPFFGVEIFRVTLLLFFPILCLLLPRLLGG